VTPEPSPSPTQLIIPSPGAVTWDIVAQWVAIGILIACTVAVIFFVFNYLPKVKKIKPFYASIAAVAVLGGVFAFLLPVAFNSGFGKDDDGRVLRQLILYTTGGLLGVITLGETHRKNNQEKEKNENDHTRQVHTERRSRYTKAVEQLGDKKATVRLGGIYTLVGLVDEWLSDGTLDSEEQQKEGQVIINNLCSYIRSPFPTAEKIEEYEARKELEELEGKEPEILNAEKSLRLKALQTRFNESDEYKKPEDIATDYTELHEEQDVRLAIFEEMSKRSKVSVDKSKEVTVTPGVWSTFEFDFSRAPIFYPLNNLVIGQVNFASARFYGEADFRKTKFTRNAHFLGAEFTGAAHFLGAEFTGAAHFRKAKFIEYANFTDAKFTGNADFRKTKFTRNAHFKNAKFTRGAGFSKAEFTGAAHFRNAKFTEYTYFTDAKFTGYANFKDAKFTGYANFKDAKFTGNADLKNAKFARGAGFGKAKFTGKANFGGVIFTEDANFKESYFEKYAPLFAYNSGAARFSDRVNWTDSNFSVRSGSQPIELGSATLGDKTVSIPFGTVVFDPDSWDEKTQEYTHMSITCCRIRRSPHHQE